MNFAPPSRAGLSCAYVPCDYVVPPTPFPSSSSACPLPLLQFSISLPFPLPLFPTTLAATRPAYRLCNPLRSVTTPISAPAGPRNGASLGPARKGDGNHRDTAKHKRHLQWISTLRSDSGCRGQERGVANCAISCPRHCQVFFGSRFMSSARPSSARPPHWWFQLVLVIVHAFCGASMPIIGSTISYALCYTDVGSIRV